ncbi:50S ribosomal protein L30e [archaeon]|nr:50S ribosomal protein L30e [archaeon]
MIYKINLDKATLSREFTALLRTGSYVYGYREVTRLLKRGSCKALILAEGSAEHVYNDVLYYARLSNTPVLIYKGSSKELGGLLGKRFPISVLAIVKEGECRLLTLVREQHG